MNNDGTFRAHFFSLNCFCSWKKTSTIEEFQPRKIDALSRAVLQFDIKRKRSHPVVCIFNHRSCGFPLSCRNVFLEKEWEIPSVAFLNWIPPLFVMQVSIKDNSQLHINLETPLLNNVFQYTQLLKGNFHLHFNLDALCDVLHHYCTLASGGSICGVFRAGTFCFIINDRINVILQYIAFCSY